MADYEAYQKYCEEISKRQLSNSEAFDKAILSLSSAGLALSLSFFKFVVPASQAISLDLIKYSWYLFLAAIISTILSFVTSQRALAIELTHAERYYLSDEEEFEKKNNPASNLTELLNILSGLFFILAIINVVRFVVANI
jgi:hypothetical protein